MDGVGALRRSEEVVVAAGSMWDPKRDAWELLAHCPEAMLHLRVDELVRENGHLRAVVSDLEAKVKSLEDRITLP